VPLEGRDAGYDDLPLQPPQITDFTQCAKLARIVIALEPRSTRLTLLASQLVWLLGCNHVSPHDT